MRHSYFGYRGPVTLHGLGNASERLPVGGGTAFASIGDLHGFFVGLGWMGTMQSLCFDEALECLVLRSAGYGSRSPVRLDVDLVVRDEDGVRIPVSALKVLFGTAERERRDRLIRARLDRLPPQPAFRAGPVPLTGARVRARFKHARSWPRMFQDVAASDFLGYDEDCFDIRISARVRASRRKMAIPAWDDWGRDSRTRNWKSVRRTRWKE